MRKLRTLDRWLVIVMVLLALASTGLSIFGAIKGVWVYSGCTLFAAVCSGFVAVLHIYAMTHPRV